MITNNLRKRIYTSLLLFCLIYLVAFYEFMLLYTLIVVGVVSSLEFFSLVKKIFKKKIIKFIISFSFIIYIFSFCAIFFSLSNFIYLKVILFSLLISCSASDIGGFVFGKIFKGPKISKISPNKTVSGSVGSLIFCCLTFVGLIIFFTKNISLIIILTGLVTSVFCQIGDLFFSYLKRKAKTKDTGSFLPGHGGLLDRIDGILLGVPIGFIFLILFLR